MLLDFYRKTKWFIKNYNEISYGKRILNNNDLLLPQVFLGPITYCTDSLITSNNADFIREPKFAKAYKAAAATGFRWSGAVWS